MKLLNKMMTRFVKQGQLTIIDVDGNRHVHGPGGEPSATVRLTDKKLYKSLFFNPELKAGEAYMDGTLICEEGGIRGFLKLFSINASNLRGQGHQKRLRKFYKKVKRFHQSNTLITAKQNVAHHYDISNDMYKLFLDEDMQYSCGYHATPETTLAEAQRAKKAHVAAKLNLKPGNTVLDIGCGWGGLALYIAENFDVHVTGVTLSKEQHALATARIAERGLEGKVEFVLSDYRDLTGPYDRIVSYGMFEQVGVPHFLEFFTKVSDLMADDGCMLLHSIGRKGGPGSTARWIRKYIFPGGYSPALSETLAEIEKSGLWVTDIEILRIHYAETLRYWDDNFQANRAKVAAMFDERFCRMWEFYLIVSEYSFRYSKNMNFQIQLSKSVNALPITRDYMIEAERKLNSA